ncbi:aspartate aminotransferase family protein [Demequina sp. NBRC 110054]|uniref:aspartate aminotransferase family protein n=1 Tax=Demequina sp. NBRC 110054 TaxID=1570343 RepID=UPI000A02F7B4|nr:aminotransferase class III-fold pyridoxal phosphate-dependent enzyme [Demequina sp. NBRC 110054]
MSTRSTIMDSNSFRADDAAGLPDGLKELTDRRAVLGGAYRLFYRTPVHLVRGEGQYLFDADGRKYLDMYNNVASLGHAHPAVVEAVTAQMQQLNTHTRYLHTAILDYSDEILATMPEALDRIMFMCTGSEANDLAIRVAREYTGGQGIIVTRESYHGTSALTSGHSPALGSGQPIDPTARLVDAPDAYRAGTEDIGRVFADRIAAAIADMRAAGIPFAGVLADSIFSSDGVFADAPGLLQPAIELVHAEGGVWIADEVQPGFGRTGDSFWGFARHDVVPDLVTMGKPMGNGIPVSGMAAKDEVLRAFTDQLPYFNTFGGNPVSMAAARAVLTVIREEELQERAKRVGAEFRAALAEIATRHEAIGDIRGAGQFTGLELVLDRTTKEPASALALDLLEQLRERGVLTSTAGPHANVLKLRPPLAFGSEDIDWAVSAIDEGLSALGA